MAEVVICEFMDAPAVARIRASHRVIVDPDLHDRPGRLGEALGSARASIARNRTMLDRTLLGASPSLEVIGRLGVGLNNIDLDACGVTVRPTRGANDRAVAGYVIGAALEIVAGAWPRLAMVGSELGGRCLGLVGYGAIARRVATLARAFEMTVMAHDPWVATDDPAWAGVARAGTLGDLLARADLISLHVPLTAETRHLIDRAACRRMKPGAILINASRGGVVDEVALVEALDEGRIAGAALDVFDDEPSGAERRALFAGRANLLLTRHVAGLTRESNARVSALVADEVLEVLDGG